MAVAILLSSKLHDELIALAIASPSAEVCGLLVGHDSVARVISARNVAPDPCRHFEIDPETLFAAIRTERAGGERIIGYFHSHPAGPSKPSATDLAHATADGRIWLIIGEGRATAWELTEAKHFEAVDIVTTT